MFTKADFCIKISESWPQLLKMFHVSIHDYCKSSAGHIGRHLRLRAYSTEVGIEGKHLINKIPDLTINNGKDGLYTSKELHIPQILLS